MKKITDLKDVHEILDVPAEAVEFLLGATADIADGHYEFGENCYVNVMSPMTVKEMGDMEAHHAYVDVQYIIEGEENILVAYTPSLTETVAYDADKDCAFYAFANASDTILYKGEAVVLFPDDAHLGCRAVNEPMKVKKAVMKVRIAK